MGWASEEYMAELDWQSRGLIMDTNLYPSEGRFAWMGSDSYTHRPEDVRRGLMDSLKALAADKIDMWYPRTWPQHALGGYLA